MPVALATCGRAAFKENLRAVDNQSVTTLGAAEARDGRRHAFRRRVVRVVFVLGLLGAAVVLVLFPFVAIYRAIWERPQSPDQFGSLQLVAHFDWAAAVIYVLPLSIAAAMAILACVFVLMQHRWPRSEPPGRWRGALVAAVAYLALLISLVIATMAIGALVTTTTQGRPSVWIIEALVAIGVALCMLPGLRMSDFRPQAKSTILVTSIAAVLLVVPLVADAGQTPAASRATASAGFWVSSASPASGPSALTSVFCMPSGQCLAKGNGPRGVYVAASTSSGHNWRRVTQGHQSLNIFPTTRLTCWDSLHCIALRPGIETTSNGGRSWSQTTAPAFPESWSGACPTSGTCIVAVANPVPARSTASEVPSLWETNDGGRTFRQEQAPIGLGLPLGMTCVDQTECYIVGSAGSESSPGTVFVSHDSGATWTQQSVPLGTPLLSDVSCSDSAHCVAVGATRSGSPQRSLALWTANGGTTWHSVELSGVNNDVIRVSCMTDERCVAVGQPHASLVAYVTNDRGRDWSRASTVGPSLIDTPPDLSCTESGTCVAVGTYTSDGHPLLSVSNDAGITWRSVGAP